MEQLDLLHLVNAGINASCPGKSNFWQSIFFREISGLPEKLEKPLLNSSELTRERCRFGFRMNAPSAQYPSELRLENLVAPRLRPQENLAEMNTIQKKSKNQ